MEQLILLIVFGFIMIIVASVKGFNPMRWFFAAGLLGLIILFFLPSASAKDIDENEKLKRAELGNKVGTIISIIALILAGILILVVISNSDEPGEIIIPLLLIIIPLILISISIFIFLKVKKIKPVKADKVLIAVHAILGLIISVIVFFLQVALLVGVLKLEYRGVSMAPYLVIALIEMIFIIYVLGLFLWRKKIRAKESEINPA